MKLKLKETPDQLKQADTKESTEAKELIAALQRLGYRTELLMAPADVSLQLARYNDAYGTDHTLTADQIDEILTNVSFDLAIEQANDSLFTEIEIYFNQ